MSLREVPYFQVFCDWPDCGMNAHADEGSDYSAWGEADGAREEASNSDWHVGLDGTDYCHRHPATWASDHEKGEPFPDPPYLLIHDGDTDDGDDDGKVTLVAVAEQAAS